MIEIIVGLPHLRAGPILARASAMRIPALISANCLSRWKSIDHVRTWQRFDTRPLARAHTLASLDLDSAGFVAMHRYHGLPWTVDAYMALASAFPFRRIASVDYCCEPEIARDRSEVLDRIARTVRANYECRSRARDLAISERFMPVLQGRTPDDYERCAEALGPLFDKPSIIGVGSLCRRDIGGHDGLVAIIGHLDRVLPLGIRLHGFGVKGSALPYLKPFEHRVASIDSQAYGIAARNDARHRHASKSDALVAAHMARWTLAQHARTSEAARRPRWSLPVVRMPTRPDRWSRALALAESEIRDAITTGDLDHDAVTACWVQAWASDIVNDPERQRALND